MNEFDLEGEPLRPGDTIDIVFGDRSGGSPGAVIQPMDESAFEQSVFVDAFGTREFLPLSESPRLTFVGASASELVVLTPTDWVVGESRLDESLARRWLGQSRQRLQGNGHAGGRGRRSGVARTACISRG